MAAQNKNNEANKGNEPMVAETGQEKKKPIRIMNVDSVVAEELLS